jgi:hypothetical protein
MLSNRRVYIWVFLWMVKDTTERYPNERGELQYVVEFVIYNTPGAHGYTPRDIDRRWGLATTLETELQPFTVNEFEPMSEYVASLFRPHREVRVLFLGFLQDSSCEWAEMANRFRTSKSVQPGMSVVLRDPRHRKAGGGLHIGSLTLTLEKFSKCLATNAWSAAQMGPGCVWRILS